MSEKRDENYDPVNAAVPGVDQKMRAEEIKNLLTAGDPMPSKSLPQAKEKIIFKLPGLKITK